MRKCIVCNADLPEGAKNCPQCGFETTVPQFASGKEYDIWQQKVEQHKLQWKTKQKVDTRENAVKPNENQPVFTQNALGEPRNAQKIAQNALRKDIPQQQEEKHTDQQAFRQNAMAGDTIPEKKKKTSSVFPFVLLGGIALVAVVIAAALLPKDGSSSSEVNDHPTQNTIANQPDDLDTAAGTEKDTKQIALILSSRDASATEMEEGAIATAEDAGYKILSYDAQSDPAKQLQFIEEAVAQGAEAILIDPVDADAAQSAVDAAGDIPLVFVNHAPSDLYILDAEQVAFCGSNDDTAGYMQGEYLASFCHTKGLSEIRYILLQGELGQISQIKRCAGVLKALEDNGITAISAADLAGKYDRTEAKNKMAPVLAAGTKFDCIIANDDAMALGAIDACEEAGIDPSTFPILGMDCTADGAQAVRDGKLTMTLFKNFGGIGKGAVQAAINLIDGDAANVYTSFDADESGESYSDSIVWVPYQTVNANNIIGYLNRE
ncbi:substrate-binding domain-containing protein [Butyricicoccus sp.]|uniref:substrate-binding domain-containing protein n=1 Tax=Butyricicoccus sp. TaxID=2049021 RepID=UPI003F173A9B